MKISELVTKLQEIQSEAGDLEVHTWPYDGQSMWVDKNRELTPIVPEVVDCTLNVHGSHYPDGKGGWKFQTVEKKLLLLERD